MSSFTRFALVFVFFALAPLHAADEGIALLEAHFSGMTKAWLVPGYSLKIHFQPLSSSENGPPLLYVSSVSLFHNGELRGQQQLFAYPAAYLKNIFEKKDRTLLEWLFRTVIAYPDSSVVAFLNKHPSIVTEEFSEVFFRFDQMVDTVAKNTKSPNRSSPLARYTAACEALRTVANTDLKILTVDCAVEKGFHRHVIRVETPRQTSFTATTTGVRKDFGSVAEMEANMLEQFIRLAADNVLFRPLFARDAGLEGSAFYIPGVIGNCELLLARLARGSN